MTIRIHKPSYGWGTVKRVGYGVPERMMHLIHWDGDRTHGVAGGWYEIGPEDQIEGAAELAALWREHDADMTREEYRTARKKARTLKGRGRIVECPVRTKDGYPGLWVSSTGEIQGWYGFDKMWEALKRSPD